MPQIYGYVDEPMDGNRGPPLCLWSKEFYETDPSRGFVRGYTLPVRPRHRPGDRGDRQRGRRASALGRGPSPRLPQAASTTASASASICEDLPEEHNRVTLDPVLKDSHGIPAPKIDYTHQREQPRR